MGTEPDVPLSPRPSSWAPHSPDAPAVAAALDFFKPILEAAYGIQSGSGFSRA